MHASCWLPTALLSVVHALKKMSISHMAYDRKKILCLVSKLPLKLSKNTYWEASETVLQPSLL